MINRNKIIHVSEGARRALDPNNDPEYRARVAEAQRIWEQYRTSDFGGGFDDPRPSKLRDAMRRLGLTRVIDAKPEQRMALERAATSDKIAEINQRNKEVWEERTRQGRPYAERGVKP